MPRPWKAGFEFHRGKRPCTSEHILDLPTAEAFPRPRSTTGRRPAANRTGGGGTGTGHCKSSRSFWRFGDLAALAFAPGLHVTKVRVLGTQTLTPQQVFQEAQVPNNTNILWMLHQPSQSVSRQTRSIDHAERTVRLPDTLILTVTERQPYAVLASERPALAAGP